jgi:ABC-type multidrug transport system fused ATPase/permease subunit
MTNPYWSLMRTAWHYARDQRRHYVLIYAMFLASNVLSAFEPIIWGWFINALQRDGVQAMVAAGWYVAAYLGIHFSFWLLHGPARIVEQKLAFQLSGNFLDDLYRKVLSLPVKWHQDHHSGATINRVRKAYEALKHFFQGGFNYVNALLKFLFSFAAMLWFSPLFGTVAVALGLLTVFIILKFDKPFIETLDEVNEREHAVSSGLFDSLSNILTVITLRLEGRLQGSLFEKVGAIFPPYRRNTLINEWKWFIADSLVALTYVVMVLGYIWQNWQPGVPLMIGGLVTLVGYVQRFTSVFHDVAWQYTDIVRYNTDVQTARYIFEAYDQQHRPEPSAPLPTRWHQLDIQNLSYAHRDGTEAPNDRPTPGLTNVSLHLRRGQRIALVGESGSGKSTLLALLRGLYPPEPGVLFQVDGQHTDRGAIADTVTLFPQEPEIFENTIRYNITLGLPFPDEDLNTVCTLAHFGEVAAQLPKGLDSNIQEKGVNLSGGQKQRLALARGILAARSSDIVLLDEPTSSVDPKTEALIYDRLFAEFSDKVIVSSLHRLHLLHKFDHIYVMHQGQIIAEGTLEHLRAHSPAFQELWQHQEQTGMIASGG